MATYIRILRRDWQRYLDQGWHIASPASFCFSVGDWECWFVQGDGKATNEKIASKIALLMAMRQNMEDKDR